MKMSGLFAALSALSLIFGLTWSGKDYLLLPFKSTQPFRTLCYIIIGKGATVGTERLYIKYTDETSSYVSERKLAYQLYPEEITATLKLDHQQHVQSYVCERYCQGIRDLATLEPVASDGWQYFATNGVQKVHFLKDIALHPDFTPLCDTYLALHQCLIDRYDFSSSSEQQVPIYTNGCEMLVTLRYSVPYLQCLLREEELVKIEVDHFHQIERLWLPDGRRIQRATKCPEIRCQFRQFESSHYCTEEVTFYSDDGTRLWENLVLPIRSGSLPALVMISGTGPNSYRECGVFSAIAHRLGEMGVATLSFNKRGVLQSGGNYLNHTHDKLIDDAEAAYVYLRSRTEIDTSRIGLLGHSEGGIIAPAVAARQPTVKACVVMAAPAVKIYPDLATIQTKMLGKLEGWSTERIQANLQDIESTAFKLLNDGSDWWMFGKRCGYMGWYRSLIHHPPKHAFQRLPTHIPVLIFQGENDIYIPPIQSEMLMGYLEEAGHIEHQLLLLPGIDHNFGRIIPIPDCLPYNEFVAVDETFLTLLEHKTREILQIQPVSEVMAVQE
ncbi:alpha/beta fold hydrolase [candidate division KSB1 bacterium]|nr:alpha/beta fold hydrolase [candidate division KSB1 bacterium]